MCDHLTGFEPFNSWHSLRLQEIYSIFNNNDNELEQSFYVNYGKIPNSSTSIISTVRIMRTCNLRVGVLSYAAVAPMVLIVYISWWGVLVVSIWLNFRPHILRFFGPLKSLSLARTLKSLRLVITTIGCPSLTRIHRKRSFGYLFNKSQRLARLSFPFNKQYGIYQKHIKIINKPLDWVGSH